MPILLVLDGESEKGEAAGRAGAAPLEKFALSNTTVMNSTLHCSGEGGGEGGGGVVGG